MKIAYNPKTAAVITAATAVNDDILFDLNARKVWAKGLRMGADWADISSKPSSLKNPAAIKFRDINGSEVSYDGSVAKDLTTGTYTARLPYGFSSFDSKPTWGSTTGTSIACWKEASGGSIDFRKDNPSSGKMSIKVDGRVYVNEGTNPVLSAEHNNNYWGMRTPDGGNDWIRTPNSGLLPYINGNAGSGHSSLGTNSWYFSTAYIDKVYGSLKGNADTATKATKADNATNAENADKLDGWHKDNIQWTGYISSNTADLQSYWAKMYDVTITTIQYNEVVITFLVSDGYNGNFSIFHLKVRQNGANGSGAYNLSVTLRELVGNLRTKIVAYYNNKTGNVQIWGNVEHQWGVLNYTILKKTERVNIDFATLGTLTARYFNTVQTQPTTDYTKVTMSRVGQVQYAESSSFSTQATKLQTARNLWGNSFDGTKDINDSIVFPAIGDTATSSKISWSGASDGADIYYQTTAKDQGNLVLNVKDDANAYIQLALNGVFKSHFDVANSYWTGKSALADKWATARTFTIGNTAKNVDGSGNVSWTLAEIGVRDTWRTVQVNGTSIGNNTLNLCGSTYIGLTNVNGKVTFSLVGSSTTANQAILSNGTANGWTLKTLNIANWDTAYNLRHSHANKSVLDGITTGLVTNWNTAYTFVSTITGTDTDNVINKWEEIVNFLAGITEDNKLNTLLNSKLSIQQLSAKDILTTKTNNALFWVNTVDTAGSITTGPFTDHPYALLSVTNYSQNDTNGKVFYRSRLAFSSAGDIKVASCHHQNEYKQDDAWYNVLTSKNSSIKGSTITLNGTSITVYSSGTADGRYVKKSGDTMTGTLTINTSGFGALHITRNDDANAAAIQFRGKSSVYGYIGLNGASKDKQFLRYSSDVSKTYTILDTSSTNVTDGKGVINGTTITQVDNSTNADKLDGYHAGGLLTALSNSNRGISLTVGGTTKSLSNISVGDADTVDGEHASAFTRIVGRHSIATNGTAPYRYIHLFRIANSNGYSTVDCEIDLRTRNHSAKLEIRIVTSQYPYGADGSSISIIKKVINGRFCNLWVLQTVQSSNYNYYDIYYESGGWNSGVYDIILRGNNGTLVFEHKGTKLDALPDNVSVVNNQWVMWNDIAGKPSSFTPAAHNHDGRYLRLNGQDTMQGNLNLFSYGSSYIGRGSGNKSGEDFTEANIVIRSWYGISFKSFDDKVRTYIDTRTGNIGTKGRFIGNLTGSATSATKVIVNQHTANDSDYPLVWSNQSNTSNATENQLYKSWQDLYYNPKNKRLFVGGAVSTAYINATNTVTSAGFKHSGVTKNADQYVLTAGGGYTFLNQAANELAHEFNVSIAVTSEWQDIAGFHGGSQTFLTQPGTYIVQVYYESNPADGMYQGYFSGIMSWYTGTTNSNNADEIVLHRVGHAYANTIYLRTRESLKGDPDPYTKLQISANSNLKEHTYKFKFKRIC